MTNFDELILCLKSERRNDFTSRSYIFFYISYTDIHIHILIIVIIRDYHLYHTKH